MRFRVCLLFVTFLLGVATPAAAQDARTVAALENHYFAQLDQWVGTGGEPRSLQTDVVETCGKLVMLMATRGEQSAFLSTDRPEFDLRVDVCRTITVHRVQPQPRLADPGMVALICDRGNVLFERLCERSGLR